MVKAITYESPPYYEENLADNTKNETLDWDKTQDAIDNNVVNIDEKQDELNRIKEKITEFERQYDDSVKSNPDVITKKEYEKLKFDDFLSDIPEDILSLKYNETIRTVINGFPESFDKIIYNLARMHSLKGFIIEECLVSYGLNRLVNDEISSFGLKKKVDILDKMQHCIVLPASKKNKLEVIYGSCVICRKKISLSEQSMSFVAQVGSILDMGISDLLMLCVLISLNESTYVNKEFIWFKKEFYLEREKKGLKVIKDKNLQIRSKLKLYRERIDQIYYSYKFRQSSVECSKDLTEKEILGMKLTENEELEFIRIKELRREMHDIRLS